MNKHLEPYYDCHLTSISFDDFETMFSLVHQSFLTGLLAHSSQSKPSTFVDETFFQVLSPVNKSEKITENKVFI